MKFNDRLLQDYALNKKISTLHGHARLDLLRDNKVVHRVEHDNTITPWIANAIGAGNFHDQILPSKIMPIKQWFEGCLLTDKENDPASSMIAGDANVVAQASNDAYSGDNTKRGSVNNNESGIITDGYRFVWDWATSQGNGVIASVCLTRAAMGATAISDSSSYAPPVTLPPVEAVSSAIPIGSGGEMNLGNLTIIDIEKERGYRVEYSSNTITIKEYAINTTRLHIIGATGMTSSLVDTHTISQGCNTTNMSVSYTGDTIHLIAYNSNTLYDYAVGTDTWERTATTHTYTGANFTGTNFYQPNTYTKDMCPIIGDYIYVMSTNGTKIAKCNLKNDADVELLDNPVYTILGQAMSSNAGSGPSVILPNGDFIKRAGRGSLATLYYHDNRFYASGSGDDYLPDSSIYHCRQGMHGSSNGVILVTGATKGNATSSYLYVTYPYVSTVNNLDSAVTKSADLTMKLTYEITESE